MPAKAGIQVGTGYFFVFQKVACPLSGIWIPGRPPLQPEADPSQPEADPPVEDFGGFAGVARNDD
jgi:hypothetical protein